MSRWHSGCGSVSDEFSRGELGPGDARGHRHGLTLTLGGSSSLAAHAVTQWQDSWRKGHVIGGEISAVCLEAWSCGSMSYRAPSTMGANEDSPS